MTLEQKLKNSLIEKYKEFGDKVCLVSGKNSWTGNQVADEIEKESETGVRLLNGILNLTIELLSRQKETLK